MTLPVPLGPKQITADWLSAALGRPVRIFGIKRIGQDQGFTGGGLFRIVIGQGDSLIAKLSPADPNARATFAGANAREVAFYTQFARGLPAPECAYGACDARTGASILLLQDLSGLRAGVFVDGFSTGDARSVLSALARMHAAWWNAPELASLTGAEVIDEFPLADAWASYPGALAKLLPDIDLPHWFLALGRHVSAHQADIFGGLLNHGPLTLLHRDCQIDNVMFDAGGAAVILDWQFMGKGRGTYDVAYFLISSLPVASRRGTERQLVGFYHTELLHHGVTGYTAGQCWDDYRRAAISKLCVSIVATSMLDNSGPAKQAWRRADLNRLLAFCEDHALTPMEFTV